MASDSASPPADEINTTYANGHGEVNATKKAASIDHQGDEKDPAMATTSSQNSGDFGGSGRNDKLKEDAIDIELQLRDSSASQPSGAFGRDTNDGHDSVAEGQFTDYRTYRRRWFGLVQLTLLNIIVSWDVSSASIIILYCCRLEVFSTQYNPRR